MNGGVMVVCPRGTSGEIFAAKMAGELEKLANEGRVGFAYPYLPEYDPQDPGLLQQVSAVVRDGMTQGITEFLFVDSGIAPVLPEISKMMNEVVEPLIYDSIGEAKSYYVDPQLRPIWIDRWGVMKEMTGFENLYTLDRTDLQELIEEVVWRTRGITGGNTEETPEILKKDLLNEERLRTRSEQLLFKLAEIATEKGIILGNVDLEMALTRYIDEEYREFMYKCRFVSLAQILAFRLV